MTPQGELLFVESILRSKLYDSRVLRNGTLPTPSGPEGSSGRNTFRVPQGCLAITSY